MSENQRSINRGIFMRAAVDMTSRAVIRALIPEAIKLPEQEAKLSQWLEKVAPLQAEYLAKIDESGKSPQQLVRKGLTKEAFRKEIEMYFPIYCAASEKYGGISPSVFLVLHARETVFSKMNNRDGAMQILRRFKNERWKEEAIVGWEFLKLIQTKRPNDPRDIMSAGKYLIERWGSRPREAGWDIDVMDTYQSIEDGLRMQMARNLVAITN